MQARGDQAAESPSLGELAVHVKRLRIPLPRERDDGCFGHGHATAHESVADLEILVVAIGQRGSSRQGLNRRSHCDADCVRSETLAASCGCASLTLERKREA